MGDIVNLRQKRKEKARDERERQAEENRRRFGQTKDEKKLSKARDAMDARNLDGHKRDDP